jgi:hypothetical protein
MEALIGEIVATGFPPTLVDRLAVLVINRPGEVVPKLARLVRGQLTLPDAERNERTVRIVPSLIAYSGDESALPVIEELVLLDRPRFMPLIQSLLDNAQSWRNPYNLAYRAIESRDESIRAEVERWVQLRTDSWVSQRLWAESMIERYPGGLTESVLENDPLVAVLKPDLRAATKSRIREESARIKERERR